MRPSFLPCLGLLLGLVACAGLDQSAGGSSYETENALTGRIAGTTLPGDTVESSNRGRRTVADSSGRFLLDSLASGIHALRAKASGGRAYVVVKDSTTVQSGLLRPEPLGEIFLDDFEDGDSRNRYGAWIGEGWWWIAAAPAVQLTPEGIVQTPAKALAAEPDGNTYLQFSAAFSGSSATDWAEAGVHLGQGPYDLSSLTAVRFRAKGTGTLTVRLVIDGALAGQSLETTVSLGAGWNDFEIPVAAFQLPAWSGSSVDSAGRAAKLSRCTGLAWAFIASSELWLDDVRLSGPSPSALWGTRAPP